MSLEREPHHVDRDQEAEMCPGGYLRLRSYDSYDLLIFRSKHGPAPASGETARAGGDDGLAQ